MSGLKRPEAPSPGVLNSLAAFLAGGISVLAFAPYGYSLISVLALAVLFRLWLTDRPAQGFRLGLAFGLGLMGFGVFWLRNSIAQFGGLNLPLAILITLGFSFMLALFYGLTGWLCAMVARSRLLPAMTLLFPAFWTLSEWLRSWFLGGFTWLSLGYSQLDLPLAGYAPLLGIYGVSLLAALSAGLLNLWRTRWIVLLPMLWAGGWLLQQAAWSEPAGEPFSASLLQGNIPQEDKWLPSQFTPTLDLYLGMTDSVSDSKLVIWPETAVPAFADRVEADLLRPLHARMAAQGRDLATGIPVRQDDGSYFNAVLSLGASGRQTYFKRHLVPFGEFMPLRIILEPLISFLAIPMSEFSAGGAGKPLLNLAGYAAGVSICFEDSFGDEIVQALPEAAFLINVSNDAWFGDSLAPHQHMEMARMRALETGRYLLRATNTGISAIINEKAEVLSFAPQFHKAVLTAKVQPLQGLTPYARLGNGPLLTVSLLMLLLSLLHRKFQRRPSGG